MPEIKWAHPENLRQWRNSLDSCPVLALDQIEAWLNPLLTHDGMDERQTLEEQHLADDDYWTGRTEGGFVDWYARKLLAQVQALKRDLAASQIVTRIIDEERQELIALRQQLAAMTRERDEAIRTMHSVIAELKIEKAELAVSQVQCKKMEEKLQRVNNSFKPNGADYGR